MGRMKMILLMFLILAVGCTIIERKFPETPTTEKTEPSLLPTATKEYIVKPSEIIEYIPKGEMGVITYNETLDTTAAMRRGINLKLGIDFEKITRIQLFVNNAEISNELLQFSEGLMPGPWYVSWGPELGPGDYSVRFSAVTDNGKQIEYRWNFRLVDP